MAGGGYDPYDYYDPEEWRERVLRFRDPGGRSALHPGKRCCPCPTCRQPNRLTVADVAKGYQCDECVDRAEGLGY